MPVSPGLRGPNQLLLENISIQQSITVHEEKKKKDQGHCGWVINYSVKLQSKMKRAKDN